MQSSCNIINIIIIIININISKVLGEKKRLNIFHIFLRWEVQEA